MTLAVALMTLSHYGTTLITFILLLTVGVVLIVFRFRMRLHFHRNIIIACLLVATGIGIWYFALTETPFYSSLGFIKRTVASAGGETVVTIYNGTATELALLDIESRDKITQAAFGIRNPDNDTVFQFNWFLLIFGWLTIGVSGYGFIMSLLRKGFDIEYLLLSIAGYGILVLTVLVPMVSRGYGIERSYLQLLTFLGIYFYIGSVTIGRKIRVHPYIVMLAIQIPYFYLMYTTGVIHSITGL
jgi:uncharacterized membrane protein